MRKSNSKELPKLRNGSINVSSDDSEEQVYMPSFDATWMYCTHDTPRSEREIHEFEEKNEMPPPIDRAQVAQYLQRKRILSMLNKDYEKAGHFYDVNAKFARACVAADDESSRNNQIALLNLRINEITFALQQLKEEHNKEINEVHSQMNKRRSDLEKQQSVELSKFDEKWSSAEILSHFSTPSQKLLELMRKEQKLVLMHEFEEAANARKEVEMLEQEETGAAQKRAEFEAYKKRNALIEQHRKQMGMIDDRENKVKNDLEIKYQRTQRGLKTRLTKLTIDKEKGTFREPTQSTLRETPRMAQIPMALTTPRTRRKLLSFRNSTTAPKLGLKPIKARPRTSFDTRIRL